MFSPSACNNVSRYRTSQYRSQYHLFFQFKRCDPGVRQRVAAWAERKGGERRGEGLFPKPRASWNRSCAFWTGTLVQAAHPNWETQQKNGKLPVKQEVRRRNSSFSKPNLGFFLRFYKIGFFPRHFATKTESFPTTWLHVFLQNPQRWRGSLRHEEGRATLKKKKKRVASSICQPVPHYFHSAGK